MTPIRCANSPATAQIFVQLSLRRQRYSRAQASAPILDLLLPSTTARACSTRATTRTTDLRNIHSNIWRQERPMRIPRAGREISQPAAWRAFGTTALRRGTEAIFNPQHNDEGQEMVLGIGDGAAKRLSEIMARDSNPHLALRIQVESGGCHGFQYLMSLVTLPPEMPSSSAGADVDAGDVIGEDDTVFAYKADDADGAERKSTEAPKIILDGPSLELLQGSKVDFTMELIGSQFKIVDNPHATSSCGCGTSFDIKA